MRRTYRTRTHDTQRTVIIGVLVAMLSTIIVLSGAVAYMVTDTHLVRCEVVNSATFGLMGDDPDGEPLTVCWDVLTDERVA